MLDMNTQQLTQLKERIKLLLDTFPLDEGSKDRINQAADANQLFTELFKAHYAAATVDEPTFSITSQVLAFAIDYLQRRSIGDLQQILQIAHAAVPQTDANFDIYKALPPAGVDVLASIQNELFDEQDKAERTYDNHKFQAPQPMLRSAFNYFGQVQKRTPENWQMEMRNDGTLSQEDGKTNRFLGTSGIDLLLTTMFANDQDVALVDPFYPIPDSMNKKMQVCRTLSVRDENSFNMFGYAIQELLKKAGTQNPRIPIFIPLGLPGHVTFMVLDFAPGNTVNLHFKDSLGSLMPENVKDFVIKCINDSGMSLGSFAEAQNQTQVDFLTCPIHVVTSAVYIKTFLADRKGKVLDLGDINILPQRDTAWCWNALKAMQKSLIEFANLGFPKTHCVLPATPKASPETGPAILKAAPPAPDSTISAQSSRSLQDIINKLVHWDNQVTVQTLKNDADQVVNYLVKPVGVNDKQILNIAVNETDQKITAITIDDTSHEVP